MPWFTVTVVAEQTFTQDFEIEADNLEEAKQQALTDAMSSGTSDWEETRNFYGHQVTDADQLAEEKEG